jgi:hypothetical protein
VQRDLRQQFVATWFLPREEQQVRRAENLNLATLLFLNCRMAFVALELRQLRIVIAPRADIKAKTG